MGRTLCSYWHSSMGMVELTSGDVWRVQHLSLGAHETGDGLQEADLNSPRAALRWPARRGSWQGGTCKNPFSQVCILKTKCYSFSSPGGCARGNDNTGVKTCMKAVWEAYFRWTREWACSAFGNPTSLFRKAHRQGWAGLLVGSGFLYAASTVLLCALYSSWWISAKWKWFFDGSQYIGSNID